MTAAQPLSRLLREGQETISTREPTPQLARRPVIPDQPEPGLTSGSGWQDIAGTPGDLSAALPDNVALLKVVLAKVDDQDCFKLELYWRHQILVTEDPEEQKRQGRPGFVYLPSIHNLGRLQ